jgi:hypothetical protein
MPLKDTRFFVSFDRTMLGIASRRALLRSSLSCLQRFPRHLVPEEGAALRERDHRAAPLAEHARKESLVVEVAKLVELSRTARPVAAVQGKELLHRRVDRQRFYCTIGQYGLQVRRLRGRETGEGGGRGRMDGETAAASACCRRCAPRRAPRRDPEAGGGAVGMAGGAAGRGAGRVETRVRIRRIQFRIVSLAGLSDTASPPRRQSVPRTASPPRTTPPTCRTSRDTTRATSPCSRSRPPPLGRAAPV